MTRTYAKFLVALVMSMGSLGCRRTPPPPPPPIAATVPDSGPISTTLPPPPVPDPAPPAEPAVSAPLVGELERASGSAAQPALGKRARSGSRAGGSETAQREDAVAAAAEQQQPVAKQGGGRSRAETGADVTPPRAVAARNEVVAARPAPTATARATLLFKNEAGDTFKLIEARFMMDGTQLPTVLKSAERGQTQAVFSGEVPPGRHVIAAHLTYQGADLPVFTYMKGYTFRVQTDDTFVARDGEGVAMRIVCKEKTGFNDPIEKRLFVTIEGEGRP